MDERDFPSRKDIFGGQIIHFPRNISRKLKFRQGFNTDNRFLLTLENPPRFWNVFMYCELLRDNFSESLCVWKITVPKVYTYKVDLLKLRKNKNKIY